MILVERNLRKFFVITYWQQGNQIGDLVSNIDVTCSLQSSKRDQSQKKSSKIFYNNDIQTYWQQRNQIGDLVSNIEVTCSLNSSKGDQSQKKSSKIFYHNDIHKHVNYIIYQRKRSKNLMNKIEIICRHIISEIIISMKS